jgi:hypothetical protein
VTPERLRTVDDWERCQEGVLVLILNFDRKYLVQTPKQARCKIDLTINILLICSERKGNILKRFKENHDEGGARIWH